MKTMKRANQQLTDKDELTLNALEYICTTKFGKMDDLKNKIGKEKAAEFMSMGFIKSGWCGKDETWAVLDFGTRYYSAIIQASRRQR